MSGIQGSLYTAAIALCLFSAGLLRERRGRSFAWFTTFLLIATLGFVFELLMVHPAAPLKALWLGLRMGTSLLIAPCLWLAVRENVEGRRPTFEALGRGHGLAILAGLVLLVPLMTSAHLGSGYTKPPGADRPFHFLIHETMLLCIAVFAVQVPYYLWRCRRLLLASPGSSKWLQLPLLVVLTTWLLGLLRTLQCIGHAPQALSLLFALADVSVTVGAIYLIVRRGPTPAVGEESVSPVAVVGAPDDGSVAIVGPGGPARLGGEGGPVSDRPSQERIDQAVRIAPDRAADGELSEQPAWRSGSTQPNPVPIPVPVTPKYARSQLDPATSGRIRLKLEKALATPEVFTDSLLNLRSLSRTIGEKAHYVSLVINRDLNANFYELVNRQRVAQAKRLLVAEPERTVLEIALAVGFNSKSTFNTAFRRETGLTPTGFRAEQGKASL